MTQRYLYIFNDRAHAGRFYCGVLIAATLYLTHAAFWQPAMAQSQNSVLGFGDFSCNSDGSANGNLFTADSISSNIMDMSGASVLVTAPTAAVVNDDPTSGGQCSNNLGIFGRLLCFFKTTIGQIMSSMYCAFQAELKGPLNAAITTFVVLWGIAIATGMTKVTFADSFKIMFKIILVWLFATNADWGIGVGYRFFMTVAEGGSKLVLSAMNSATGSTASLTQPDAVLLSVFQLAASGTKTGLPASLNISGYCASMLAPLLLSLIVTVPAIAIFIIIMVILYIGLYARALLGYLTALILISFLFVMAPLFVSFSLFKATEKLFEQWLKYLITYSLQMVIVFAFLAMLEMVPIGTFLLNTTNLLKEYDTTERIFYIPVPIHTCGVCDPGTQLTGSQMPNMLTPNALVCTPVAANSTPPTGEVLSVADSSGNTYNVIPLLSLLQHQDFISFMVAEIIALWLVGYVMEDFLKKAPDIAKEIGGLPMAMVLGGKSMAGGITPNYVGMQSIEAGFQGFKRGLEKDPFSLNWPRRIINSVKGFGDGLMHGSADPDDPASMALAGQATQATQRVNTLEQNYFKAQQLTLSNFDSLQQSQQELDSLRTSPNSTADQIDAALQRLTQAQKNYNLSKGNEAQRLALLGSGSQAADTIYRSAAKTMLPGLFDTEVEGTTQGEGSIQADAFKASSPTHASARSLTSPNDDVPPDDTSS